MREIKFRAWNGKRIIPYWEYAQEFSGMEMVDLYAWLDNKNYLLMQYTGLKDKNGKEIYEGDITFRISFGKNVVEQVHWNDEGFWQLSDSMYQVGVYTGKFGKNTVEVIGNIYENKDLLK